MWKTVGLLFVISLNALLINKAILQYRVIKIPTYMIGLIFIILSLPLTHLEKHWGVTISISLITLTYIELIKLSDSLNIKKTIFKTGFFIGLLTMINYNFGWFYPMIILSLIYYSQFNWRHFFIQSIGFCYPFVIYYSLYLSNYELSHNPFKLDASFDQLQYYFYNYNLFLFLIFIILILSMIELYKNYYRKKENAKKAFNILIIFIVLIALKSILLNTFKFSYLLILPITIIISNYLIYTKHQKFRTFLLGLLFISFILNFFYL